MYSPTRDPASTKSEVFYWQLLGLQVFIVYGLIAVAFLTRSLSISDENFDATVLTVTVIFVSSLLHMPQSNTLNFPCLDCSRQRKKKWSNAKYRFSRQWSIRRQDTRRRACSQQSNVNIIRAGCNVIVAIFSPILAHWEPTTYGRKQAEVWNCHGVSSKNTVLQRSLRSRRGLRFLLRIFHGFCSLWAPWTSEREQAEVWRDRVSFRSTLRQRPLLSRWGLGFLHRIYIGFQSIWRSWIFGRTQAEVWRDRVSFRSTLRQRSLRSKGGPRSPIRICIGNSSPALCTSGTLGDVAMRGSYAIAGQATVRWYVAVFHHVPAVSEFVARLAIYCFLGALCDSGRALVRSVCLIHKEIDIIAHAFTRFLCYSHKLKFGGPVPRTLHGHVYNFVVRTRLSTKLCSMTWGTQRLDILRRIRGSGFRNFFLRIFILFLLGGFLLEGNPPRTGLAAPPFHAGDAEPPVQRYSERLARINSIYSTLHRSIDPASAETRPYVQQWPEVRQPEPAPTPVSLVDPGSPDPLSPEAEEFEAEILDGSCDLLNTMRSLDGDGTGFGALLGQSEGQESQATVDLDVTQPHLEFSAPDCDAEVDNRNDRATSPLPRGVDGLASPAAIDVDSDAEDTQLPLLAAEILKLHKGDLRKSRTKAKAKLKWVPKVVASQEGASRGFAAAWASLDAIVLTEEWKHPCATVREVPEFLRRQVQEAFHVATARIREMHEKKKDVELERAWKLFLLLPRMLLSRTKHRGEDGKSEFFSRLRAFQRGDWLTLVQQARLPQRKTKTQSAEVDPVQAKLRAAEQRARLGELSHARQELVGTPLAQRTMDTYYKLADPTSRPQHPRSPERLQQICGFQPASFVDLDYAQFIGNVRSAARGKSGGLSGMRNEHLKCLVFSPRLEDSRALHYVAETLARAQIPEAIRKGIALGRMTALDKGSDKVRGIAAGDTFRRVVAKTLAQQFSQEFDDACSPFQFALSTRAGTDCVGHALREISNVHPDKIIISLDGISAYDHADRAQMLEALAALPTACTLLPFVAMFYGHTSEYYWTNEEGEVWPIDQGDGGEQGDPLMPALFALGQHAALVSSDQKLQELMAEKTDWVADFFKPLLFAFLDDLYVVTDRVMARQAFDVVTGEVERIAGIRTNLGKLQLYSKNGGSCPQGFEDFPSVWTCDAPDTKNRGIVVLGSPLGTVEFCKAHAEKRMIVEEQFLDWIPKLPTFQVAWLLLYFCAAQRANHLIRLLPPSLSTEYAEKHDHAILLCLENLLQAGPLPENAKRIAVLRSVNGGLGLRSARRTADAAFWAAWADALPMLHRRVPEHAYRWSEALEYAQANITDVEFLQQLPQGLQEAESARRRLVEEGFQDCPTWEDIRTGVRPQNPDPLDRAPGEWCRGWQFFASRIRDKYFLEFEVRPPLSPAGQALLLSQGGPFASQFLQALPTKPQLEFENLHLQCLLRRRLRLPLVDGLCFCPANSHGNGKNMSTNKVQLDEFGDHLASCMRTGRVQRRANVLEKIWMQVFQEAGGIVVPNEKLRNMRIGVDPEDKRRVEFAVYNLKFGPPLLCDVTQVSPLDQNGNPHPKCAAKAGVCIEVAENRKISTYREAAQDAGQVKLETLACEIGGRWSTNCVKWVGMLAKHKASSDLPHLKRASEFAWHSRWWSLLSVAAQRALALSLTEVQSEAIKPYAGFEPRVGEILADVRYEIGPVGSRLPLRG